MIRKVFAAALPILISAHASADVAPDSSGVDQMPRLEGEIISTEGAVIGALSITGGPHGLLIEAMLQPGSLTPGWHGLHLHQVGDCSDIGAFKKSGGHMGLIPDGHGLLNPAGPEIGDVPNIWAASDGSAGYEAFTQLATTSDLMDEDGTALIVHQNRDDQISQPIGGAGPRVACAVIKSP